MRIKMTYTKEKAHKHIIGKLEEETIYFSPEKEGARDSFYREYVERPLAHITGFEADEDAVNILHGIARNQLTEEDYEDLDVYIREGDFIHQWSFEVL